MASIFETTEEKNQKELVGKLDELKGQVQALDQHVAVVESKVDEVKAGLKALEERTKRDFGLLAYNSSMATLYQELATIDAMGDRYLDVMGRYDGSPESRADVDQLGRDIGSAVPRAMQAIHLSLMGAGGGTGALRQWHTVVANKNANGEDGNRFPFLVNATFIGQLNDQYEYFEAMQVRGMNLIVEERHLRKDSNGAKAAYDRYMANLAAQGELLYSTRLTGSPPLQILFSPKANLMWTRVPVPMTVSFRRTPAAINPIGLFGVTISGAQQKLAELRTGGFSDWRLPAPAELEQLGATDTLRVAEALQEAGFDVAEVVEQPRGSGIIAALSNLETTPAGKSSLEGFYGGLDLFKGSAAPLALNPGKGAQARVIVLGVRGYKPYPSGVATP